MRFGTTLVVAAIAALALVAAVDALVHRPAEPAKRVSEAIEQPEPPSEDVHTPLEDDLYYSGLRGTLWISAPDCRLSALTFPDLPPRPAAARSCRLSVSHDLRLEAGGTTLQPDGTLAARCDVYRTEVIDASSSSSAPEELDGCAPAWKPDGTLTYVLLGEVISRDRLGRTETILTKNELWRALHAADGVDPVIESFSAHELVWLADDLLAATVRGYWPHGSGSADFLVIFRGKRLVAPPALMAREIRYLDPSPRRSFLAAFAVGDGLHVIDRESRPVGVPVRRATAIAWSPDEGWTAVASPASVLIYPTAEPRARLRLPLLARDLAWVP